LVETETANHIWSTRIDGAVSDLFDLQDKVAAEVASALHPSIRRAEVERARSKRPETLAAYDLVMRALPHLWAHRMAENPQAISYLTKALALEPTYGLAAALAAWAHGQQVAYNWATDVAAERAEGQRLIELATMTVGDDPTALTALASAIMQLGGDVQHAANLAQRALDLDPNHAWAWMRRGYGLVYTGRPEEGLKAFEQSVRMSPLDPFAFNVHLGMGLAHFAAGRPERAIEFARQALAERPGLTWPYRDLATYYANAGQMDLARDALAKFVYLRPIMSAASLRDGLRFMEPALLERYVGGLEMAGLE
jgi:tetratricopeptide (TPR) repeat protein